MNTGARTKIGTRLRYRLAAALAVRPSVFVIPGEDIARSLGLGIEAAGMRAVATPRHADVLLVVGPLSRALVDAAVVVYAQMPRPRVIVALDAGDISPLPLDHVTESLSQEGLERALVQVRTLLRTKAWVTAPQAFDVELLAPEREASDAASDHAKMDAEHGAASSHEEPTDEMDMDDPHADMGHSSHESSDQHNASGDASDMQMDHDGTDHSGMQMDHEGMDHSDMQMDHEGMDHGDMKMDHEGTDHGDMQMDHGDIQMDHGGMDHGEMEMDHEGMDHSDMQMDHGGMNHGGMKMDHGGMNHGGMKIDHGGMNHGGMQMNHGGMDHGGMDHDMDMGFMSMVQMTQDLPRGTDGLPMERVETPLGPFFSSLPSGLGLTVWLDGDTVVQTRLDRGIATRMSEQDLVGAIEGFPDRLAQFDPLMSSAYRVLALRALAAVGKSGHTMPFPAALINTLERARVCSHLNWLTSLGYVLGYRWMEQQAAHLHQALLASAGAKEFGTLQPAIERFGRRIMRTPLLKHRLHQIGVLTPPLGADVSGPIARATGIARDVRSEDQGYQALGFTPVIAEGADAYARLKVRLGECSQSLALIQATADADAPVADRSSGDGSGEAIIETPRGAAHLRIEVKDGSVQNVRLHQPTHAHIALIDPMIVDLELGDALVSVASLDLSPWEIAS